MIIILAPGPSVLFVIARAIAWGRATAVLTVLGNVTGSFVLSSLVALGIGPILQKYHIAYVAVQWGGGLYWRRTTICNSGKHCKTKYTHHRSHG